MRFADNLIIGESIAHKSDRILDRMKQKKFLLEIYCVTKASNPNNLYDIYNYLEFRSPFYKDKDFEILAIGGSKEETYKLVAHMLMAEGKV